jgi:hypothetical protein
VSASLIFSIPRPSTVPTVDSTPAKNSVGETHYDFYSFPEVSKGRNSELDIKKTICKDPRILPVWNALRLDKDFRERLEYTTETPDCTAMFEIKFADLNRDGRVEILVRGRTAQLCGATGNCEFWVLERKGKRYRIILSASDYVDASEMGTQVLRAKTKGYANLLLKGHQSASDTSYEYYKFNGREYKPAKCLVDACVVCVEPGARWHWVTCDRYWHS